jgi:predicted nucleic acid-binding protein
LSSDVRSTLRRIKPEKRTQGLRPRSPVELPFIESLGRVPKKVLLDTTVYIDIEQGRMSEVAKAVFRTTEKWHSPVTEAELVYLCGRLDPLDARSAAVTEEIVQTIEKRSPRRTLSPDEEIWREAGIYSGLLARLQGYAQSERMRLLHDALIFCTAMKHGLTVLSRNVRDFDLLQQLAPAGQVLFYSRVD